jgi:hypothetical protein
VRNVATSLKDGRPGASRHHGVLWPCVSQSGNSSRRAWRAKRLRRPRGRSPANRRGAAGIPSQSPQNGPGLFQTGKRYSGPPKKETIASVSETGLNSRRATGGRSSGLAASNPFFRSPRPVTIAPGRTPKRSTTSSPPSRVGPARRAFRGQISIPSSIRSRLG